MGQGGGTCHQRLDGKGERPWGDGPEANPARPQVSPTPASPVGPPVTALAGTSAHSQAPQKPTQTPGLYSGPPTASSSPHTCLTWVAHLQATHQSVCPRPCHPRPEAGVSALIPTVPAPRKAVCLGPYSLPHPVRGLPNKQSLIPPQGLCAAVLFTLPESLFPRPCTTSSQGPPQGPLAGSLPPLPGKAPQGRSRLLISDWPRAQRLAQQVRAACRQGTPVMAQSRSWSQSCGGGGGWEGHHLGPFGNMAGKTRTKGMSALGTFQHQKIMGM